MHQHHRDEWNIYADLRSNFVGFSLLDCSRKAQASSNLLDKPSAPARADATASSPGRSSKTIPLE